MDNNNMILTKSSGNVMRSKAVKNFLTQSSAKRAGTPSNNKGKGIMAAKSGQANGGKLRSWESYHESAGKQGAPTGSGSSGKTR